MLQRDYLLRLMETFFKALNEKLRGKEKQEYEDVKVVLDEFYSKYFNIDRKEIIENGDIIVARCILQDPVEKMEMLSELILKDARSTIDENQKKYLCQLVLKLYNAIDDKSKTYSPERERKKKETEALLFNE